jgi:prephenate dehydrogenase
MTIKLSVIGLDQIGVSIGLALAKAQGQIVRVGFDRLAEATRKAEKTGAFDQVVTNITGATRDADLIILAVPVDEIRETLQTIAPFLKAGCVVMDTSPIKAAVNAWAKELLPADRYFLGLTPSINPAYLSETGADADNAHPDLFENSLILITHAANIPEDAIQLATDLVTLLGARPMFADTFESDGLVATTHQLPYLVSAALVNTATGQPGWEEARKLAGAAFTEATSPILKPDEREFFGQAALHNRENVTRLLDDLIGALQELREMIASEDAAVLQAFLEQARSERKTWWQQRQKASWNQEGELTPKLSFAERLGRLVGFSGKAKERK